MKAVVSGASGFVGGHLARHLSDVGWDVVGLTRTPVAGADSVGDLSTTPETLLHERLDGADLVFHVAGRAHRADAGRDPAEASGYQRDNVVATERLYRAAVAAGVGRFVYFSTVKVLGEVSEQPLAEDSPTRPVDVYSASKRDAEVLLGERAQHEIPVTIVRPPLVYGPGVAGNFGRLIGLVRRGWVLPLGCASALRSMVYVGNLCDLADRLGHDDSALRIVHVRDSDDCGVADLVEQLCAALERPVRLINVPKGIVKAGSVMLGQGDAYRSLFEALQIDDDRSRSAFAWTPPWTRREGLANTVAERGEPC